MQPKLASPDECDGVIKVVAALREAYVRAKLKNNDVYGWMISKRIKKSMLPLAFQLLKKDKEYNPPEWFTKHENFGVGGYPKGFEELAEKVENQIDGFRWSSWKQDGE